MKLRYTITIGLILLLSLIAILTVTFLFSQGGCSQGTFQCVDSSVCVPQKAMCNGHVDCPNGDDESVENCGDFHGSAFIMDLMKKTNFSSKEETCVQEGVPKDCYCRKKSWIYCKNLGLTEVPNAIEGNVTRLHVKVCILASLIKETQNDPIILTNNSISFLQEDAFNRYQLELIHLAENNLKSLPDKIFQHQAKLQKVLLMNNKLSRINGQLFSGLKNLAFIFLKNNEIEEIHPSAFEDLENLTYLDLSGNKLALKSGMPPANNLIELLLENNLISSVNETTFQGTPKLEYLGLGGNRIAKIDDTSFRKLKNLLELDLSHNMIEHLDDNMFSSLGELKKLYIGNNPVIHISQTVFRNLSSLASLDLENIEIENINEEMFLGLGDLDFIYFKKYYYCTFASFVPKCAPKSDGLSTFEDLLGRPIQRFAVWFVAVVTCFGNAYVFWGRYTTRDENKSLSWMVRNLAVADLLMGVYLILIGFKDQQYRGSYHRMSHYWMASWLCSTAGALAMVSSEVSIFTLIFMSFERFLLIAVPFSGHKNLTPQAAIHSIAVLWITGFGLALLPVLIWRRSTRFYGANGMCFPLHLDDPYFAGWQFSAFIFLFINLLGILIIIFLYSGMFVSVWRTRHATSLGSGEIEFAVRFFFIILTNTACWLPIVILKILAFYRIYFPADVYAWVAVIVVPINSAFNPLLYTLTTPKYREIIRSTFIKSASTSSYLKNALSSADTSMSNIRKRSGERQSDSANDLVDIRTICHRTSEEMIYTADPRQINTSCEISIISGKIEEPYHRTTFK